MQAQNTTSIRNLEKNEETTTRVAHVGTHYTLKTATISFAITFLDLDIKAD